MSERLDKFKKTLKAVALSNISAPTLAIHHREAAAKQDKFRDDPGSVLRDDPPASPGGLD